MIATCPHCQSGFYIAPDSAGKVLNCSKCKKQVRAPDRRSGLPQQPSADGIPYALLAETKVEVEERLKTETEARQETEKKLQEALKAKTELEEKLKSAAKGEVIAEPWALTEVETRLQQALKEKKDLEDKLREEAEAKAKADTQAQSGSAAKADIEKLLQAEVEARTKAESQLKAEISAKRRAQAQLEEEIKVRENTEKLACDARTRLQQTEASKRLKRSVDLCRGLKRLTFVLSPVAAIVTGIIAYNHGFVLMSIYDRPVRLPFFTEPVYLPLKSFAFSAAGFAAAWLVYLLLCFVIKGFRQGQSPPAIKRQPAQQQNEELASVGSNRMWRSS